MSMVKPTVSFDDFCKLDLRVGKVVDVADVPGSEKLYRMTVDIGQEYGTRTVFAGVKKWYKKSQLKGKNFIFVANLAPRKMPGGESQGMMVAICPAERDGDAKPLLIPVSKTAEPGAELC